MSSSPRICVEWHYHHHVWCEWRSSTKSLDCVTLVSCLWVWFGEAQVIFDNIRRASFLVRPAREPSSRQIEVIDFVISFAILHRDRERFWLFSLLLPSIPSCGWCCPPDKPVAPGEGNTTQKMGGGGSTTKRRRMPHTSTQKGVREGECSATRKKEGRKFPSSSEKCCRSPLLRGVATLLRSGAAFLPPPFGWLCSFPSPLLGGAAVLRWSSTTQRKRRIQHHQKKEQSKQHHPKGERWREHPNGKEKAPPERRRG